VNIWWWFSKWVTPIAGWFKLKNHIEMDHLRISQYIGIAINTFKPFLAIY
jgi:hypothetical protein